MMNESLSQSSSRGLTPHDLINPGRGISSKIDAALLALGFLLPYPTLKAAVGSQVAARFNHSVTVKSHGTAWTWGNHSQFAHVLRRMTMVAFDWIAKHLSMGHPDSVRRQLKV